MIPLILLFFLLILRPAVADSPTFDEFNHITRGLALWHTHDPYHSDQHPPLANLLSTFLAYTLIDTTVSVIPSQWEGDLWSYGRHILWGDNFNHLSQILFLSRLTIIFLTLGLALAGYWVAYQMWGRAPALMAFFLLLFEPNLMAHGHYVTNDVSITVFAFVTTYLLWRLWQKKERRGGYWLLLTLAMGAALSSKSSAIGFVAIWVILALLPLGYAQKKAVSRLWQLASAGLASLVVVWATYLFEWGPFRFYSEGLGRLNDMTGPLPTFSRLVEYIFYRAFIDPTVGNPGGNPSFLLGEISSDGFVAYFPVAFLVKTPAILLVLLPLAVGVLFALKQTRMKLIFLLIPPVLFFMSGMVSALNIGYRHILPIIPFVIVMVSGLSAPEAVETFGQQFATVQRQKLWAWVYGAALLSMGVANGLIYPHYVSYFNVLAGGAGNGRHILLDSNIDWGQDLLRLKQWLADHEVREPVYLSYFGSANPALFDIPFEPLPSFFTLGYDPTQHAFNPEAPAPGIYVISVTNLAGVYFDGDDPFAWFKERTPDARIGYSLFIFEVP